MVPEKMNKVDVVTELVGFAFKFPLEEELVYPDLGAVNNPYFESKPLPIFNFTSVNWRT